MATIPTRTCPHRCFLVHVLERIQQHQYTSFRLMGLAVGGQTTKECIVSKTHSGQEKDEEYMKITLDDGTAIIDMYVPQFMINKCQASRHQTFLGKLLDCIVHVVQHPSLTHPPILQAEQISILDDDPHAELLRWLELSWSQQQQQMPPNHTISLQDGYPVPSTAVTPDDLLDIIQLDCSTTTTTGEMDAPPLGVTVEDLVLFFQLDQGTIEAFLIELQLSGQIYQNQQGNYLPL